MNTQVKRAGLGLKPAAFASSGPIETDFSNQEILIKLSPQAKGVDPGAGNASDATVAVQARLTLANLELVQGHYASARSHCEQLSRQFPGLVAKSCLAQVTARTGGANRAYQDLLESVLSDLSADDQSVIWARTILGDLAAQLGLPAARHHWQAVLSVAPDNLYTRMQLADWHLQRDDLEPVLALTRQYEQVDSLAVIRAIALKRAGHAGAGKLADQLRERFAESRWRGTLLHQRDMARFQLDFENNPQAALEHARANWQAQREPLDTRLILRAARQAGNSQLLTEVSDWLVGNSQVDARYPGAHHKPARTHP